MAVFFSDFATPVAASTWGTNICGIFDTDFVDVDDMSREAPFLFLQAADVPSTATSGDLFTVLCNKYKLVDIQYAEPGMKRIILAKT